MHVREGVTYIVVVSGRFIPLHVKEKSIRFIVNTAVNNFNVIGNNPC